MEMNKPLDAAKIAKALGAETSMPVEQVLGVRFDTITPLGFLALADRINARQAQLRRELDQSGEAQA